MTPFEEHLAASRRRQIPADWRVRILAKARPSQEVHTLLVRTRRFALDIFQRPHPLAWGAVFAGWIAIAVLNLSGPRGDALYAVAPPEYRDRLPSAQEYLVQLNLQRHLLGALASKSAVEVRFRSNREDL